MTIIHKQTFILNTYLKFQVSGPQLRWAWGGSAVLDSVNNVGGKERPMRACHHGQWYECKTCRGQVNNSVDPRVGPPGDVRPQPTTVPAPTHSAGGRSSHWLETCLQPSLIGPETPMQPALSPFSISEINYSWLDEETKKISNTFSAFIFHC